MATRERLLRAEDVLAPAYERGELWDGVFVVREPSGGWAGAVEFRVAALLATPDVARRGWGFGASQGYVVARDPDRVLAPDVSFLSRDRLRAPPAAGFVEGPPDFCAEVRSPHDTRTALVEKGGVWIGTGVRVVWCVDPERRSVTVLRPGAPPEERGAGDVADMRPALDVEVDVATLFEGLDAK